MANKINCLHYRVVLLGSPGVGFLFKKYEPKYKPTVEDLFTKTFELGCIDLEVNFLDTSGSMQFPAMRRLNITNGDAFLIVYAVDNEESYQSIKLCMEEIREIRQDYQDIPIVFAGNKCDIPRENRKLLKETVSEYVHYELPRLRAKVVECSCKDNWNIDNIFRAYLSLAKVNLSSALAPAGSISRRNNGRQQQQQQANGTRTPPPAAVGGQLMGSIASKFQDNKQKQQSQDSFNVNSQQGQQQQQQQQQRRSSSMKVSLGLRKNYDSSSSILIQRMSNCNLNEPTQQATDNNNAKADASDQVNNNNNNNNNQLDDEQVNLDTAVRWRMSADKQTAKPRSRSLIWRTSRKNRQNNNANEANCYPT